MNARSVFVAICFVLTIACWCGAARAAPPTASPEMALERQRASDDIRLENLKSRHEFENTVLDKFAIAIILAIVGYSLNKGLERYRLLAAQRNEWENKRMATVATVWNAIYGLEGKILDLQQFDRRNIVSYSDTCRVREQITQIQAEAKDVKALLDENRFLLGTLRYNHCCAYRRMLGPLLRACLVCDVDRVRAVRQALARHRTHMDSFFSAREPSRETVAL